MKKMTEFIENRIAPPLIRFANLRYIQVIQRNGLGIMSLLVIGSMFLLVASFPYQPYLDFLGDFRWKIAAASGVGTSFIALYTVITTAYATIEWYNKNKGEGTDILQPMILAVASWFLLNPAQTVQTITGTTPEELAASAQSVAEGSTTAVAFSGVSTAYQGALGVFAAIIVAIVTVELYRFFVRRKLTIKLPENVPPMVSNAFSALIPSLFVVIFWWIIGSVLALNLPEMIMNIFQPLVVVGDTPVAMLIATILNRVLWSVGIHGGNIVSGVAGTFWTQMVAENQTAFQLGETLPHIYTSIFQDNYVMIGLAPLCLALLLAKSKRYRSMGGLSTAPALFNIGEPLIFGLPIMLNPLMMIPFVLGPVIMNVLAIILVSLKWIPIPVLSVPWITPAPIKAFLSTGGDWRALAFVLAGWVINFLIFYPFVVALDRQEREVEKEDSAKKLANRNLAEGIADNS
ncbi:PTS system lactose/cellobiose-specific transporter subunit IIC [Enterococcus canis]|uniref:Permease IIC component n=1 Tax=Enterococcus canis TaxID=214095 RepID=A0A1L8RCX5_9ENTE|nr:PTS transporter subunit EIIC [Enterococcus canis]OJG17593.1 PTS system lactose/cellobiose-specific transporter subunit IIC [Enterococcus canis]